jgi:excisionase family DNA binding protein
VREPHNMTTPNLLTVTQVAARLGVSRACVHQWIDERRMRVALTLANGQKLISARDAVKPDELPRGPRPRRRP